MRSAERDGVDTGLDRDGCIRREGSRTAIAATFRPAVRALERAVESAFGDRLQAVYLYGSVPRGTAVAGRSDLDALLLFRGVPTEDDRTALRRIEHVLDGAFDQLDGVGVLAYPLARVLHPAETYDLGFFAACLCTPLRGVDVAGRLPRYRPTTDLARGTNGDIAQVLDRAERRLAAGDVPAGRACRWLARKVLRTAFTLVMPRWLGWTSDLDRIEAVVASYYPAWRPELHEATGLAHATDGDTAAVRRLLRFGYQLAGEYERVVGLKPKGTAGG